MEINFYTLSLIITFSFFLRIIFILFVKYPLNSYIIGDSSTHWLLIKKIKKNKYNIKKLYIENYLIPGKISAPILFHFFSSYFSIRILKKRPYLPNLIIYLLFIIFLFTYSLYFFSNISTQPFELSIYVLLFFTLSINNFIFRGSQINYVLLSERLLGRLLTSFFIFTLFGYYSFGDNISLILTLIFSTLIFLSSKFAIQAIVFFSLIFSLLMIDITPLIITFFGLLFAIIISKGYALRTIKLTFGFLIIYKKYLMKSIFKKPFLNTFIDLKDFLQILKSKSIKNILKYFFNKEPGRSLLIFSDLLIVFVLLIFFKDFNIFIENKFIILIIISCLMPYVVISFKFFAFAGESYRYLEYYLVFLAPFLIVYFSFINQFNILIIFFLYLFFNIFLIIYSILLREKLTLDRNKNFLIKNNKKKDTIDEIIKSSNITSKDVIFSVDMRLGVDIVSRTNCKTFWWQPGGIVDKEIFSYFIEAYPFLSSKNYNEICKKYNVNKIIVNNLLYKDSGIKYNFDHLSVISSNNQYTVFQYK